MQHNFILPGEHESNIDIRKAIAITPILKSEFESWLSKQSSLTSNWVRASNFTAQHGSICLLPDQQGCLGQVLFGILDYVDFWEFGKLPSLLPPGMYQFDLSVLPLLEGEFLQNIAIAWGLGNYQFDRYKTAEERKASLLLPAPNKTLSFDIKEIMSIITAINWVRDLVNTPAEDLGPPELASAVVTLAHEFGAEVTQIIGDDLLKENYPAIHAVGRASSKAARLIDLRWGDPQHPKLCLVGKGVCYDTGGLDIKTSGGMVHMKKDMAGAAHVLGLARMIMSYGLPVNLRVLIPAVENAIAGNAYRSGDVIKSRKGLTIEINNTDAEGRVILADALAEAMSEKPELVIDFATLTRAGRVALGPDLPALFCDHEEITRGIMACGHKELDPVWPLPLYTPYRKFIDSKVADISNTSSSPYGGCITAALFLKDFVDPDVPWVHFDLMAWNTRHLSARPEGGEAMGLRATFRYLQQHFG